ncbi:MAG: rhodanese-like domain-containing protein [Arsenophonus sp.]|nr:MAG: rhodanese-like domain-containing protein [Arsenophonus sp.]
MNEITVFLKNHPYITTIWIILFFSIIFLWTRNLFYKIKNISIFKAINLFNKDKAIFLDIRSKQNFALEHIVNSINIEERDFNKEKIEKLKKYKNKYIIIISYNGNESFKIARKLKKLNFPLILILENGIKGWLENHFPTTKTKNN